MQRILADESQKIRANPPHPPNPRSIVRLRQETEVSPAARGWRIIDGSAMARVL